RGSAADLEIDEGVWRRRQPLARRGDEDHALVRAGHVARRTAEEDREGARRARLERDEGGVLDDVEERPRAAQLLPPYEDLHGLGADVLDGERAGAVLELLAEVRDARGGRH